jgi:ribulose 1,5-bisphosphate synthetase/thiazole synthase
LTPLLIFSAFSCGPKEGNQEVFDLVIYGGTSAAVTAAVQAKMMGKSVVVVSPDIHLGGLSSGGLGWTPTPAKKK